MQFFKSHFLYLSHSSVALSLSCFLIKNISFSNYLERMFTYVLLLAVWATVFQVSFQDALKELTDGNHKFAAKSYQEFTDGKSGNVVLSPFSAETILSLTTEGAKGATQKELISGLSLPKSTEDRRDSFKSVLTFLNKSSSDLLLSANSIFIDQRFKVKEGFEAVATSVYQSGVQKVNFKNNVPTARAINNWVEQQTNNKIQDLISPNGLNGNTAMVLVNTLYLNGKWVTPFNVHGTTKQPFHSLGGKVDRVDMMHSKPNSQYNYFHCGFLQAKFLEIAYSNSRISMTFILTDDPDKFEDMEDNLKDYLTAHRVSPQVVEVAIPRFTISTTIDFNAILRKLGIERAFSPLADFSGIAEGKNLLISSVMQKAFINVTETGTEAAAATSVSVSTTGIIVQPSSPKFIADRPFVYYIRDDESGLILFMGRYTNGS